MGETIITASFQDWELAQVVHAMEHAIDGTECPEMDEDLRLVWKAIAARLLSLYVRGTQEEF